MKYLILLLFLFVSLESFAAGVQWNNYPTTNSLGATDTFIVGNGSTNLTISTANVTASVAQPAINTTSNLLNTLINTSSNLQNGAINTSSNLVYANANTAINTSSNLVFGNSTNATISVLPPRTNYVAGTNITTAGQALVVVGFDQFNGPLVKGTNWPTGGSTPNGLVTNLAGADIVVTNATVNTTITSNSVTSGSFTANGGPVSLIPTNAAVVSTVVGVAPSLPFGITNSLAGRAQPVIQYYVIDAATGVPILTLSNETSGVKLRIAYSALAIVETNFTTLPTTSTNTIWRARDESTGTGASVGILTNWFIGL